MKKIIFSLGLLLIISCVDQQEKETGHAMVVTAHTLASDIGLEIIKAGGNAFDAAIAVNYVLAVTYPRAGNIAGGGFMVYRTFDGNVGSLDYREKAPKNSTKDMYLDADQNIIENFSTLGAMAVGVPGTVAGMAAIHEKFGSKPMNELLEPAIRLARQGYAINDAQAEKWDYYRIAS